MTDKTDQAATDPIDSSKINDILWKACDTFRGTVDPSIYKDYILTMLFLKYISDVWQDHYESYKREHGDHPELIEELLKNERFVLPREAKLVVGAVLGKVLLVTFLETGEYSFDIVLTSNITQVGPGEIRVHP